MFSNLFKPQIVQCDEIELFVIFGAMRSGSNLLQEKLNYFDDLLCLGELYNPSFVGVDRPHINKFSYAGYGRNDPDSRKKRQQDPFLLIQKVQEQAKKEGKIPGFRLFDGHNKDVRRVLLNNPRVRKVLLQRNLVDSFISLELARESGQWVKRDEKAPKVTQVHFDIDEFEQYVAKTQRYFSAVKQRLDETNQPYKLIDYQDVLDDQSVEDIARFVGSKQSMQQQQTTLRKQNKGSIEDKVINFDQVKDYLNSFNKSALG
ncbi:hypothetical protein [Thalassotalea sp. PS06]|uniref:hypothetical protein n=1 Tax=Thalassotalea sp. PS06 TaxID=2594005 RepID=UPI0011657053|nr:hypothetical protein [Thalassotalea sp. PS06]QDP01793.1 hypothetical protein FNC98_10850 [Thalassotalea sp. PS06]